MRQVSPASKMGRVLIIAGSDSGGGAGVQADLKAVTMMGAYAATAITAVTVQNTLGVSRIHTIPLDVIEAQARTVLEDIGADVIKTGMLGDAATAALAARLVEEAGVPAVVDPVMTAHKDGSVLLRPDAVSTVRSALIPRAALLTPNAPEAAILSGRAIETTEDLRRAGEVLLRMGCKAVLMKGGHIDGPTVTDFLITADGEVRFESERIETRHTHGTGCTLASACAALLARGFDLETAVTRARSYVFKAILTAPGLGGGRGPLDHGWPLRALSD